MAERLTLQAGLGDRLIARNGSRAVEGVSLTSTRFSAASASGVLVGGVASRIWVMNW